MILFGKIQSRCLVSEWKRAAWYQSERGLPDFNGQEGSPIQSYLSCDFLEIRMPIKNGFFCLAVVPQQKSFLGKFEKAGLAGTEALSYVQIRWGKQLAFISGLSYRLASLAVCGELLGVHRMFHSSISDAFYWWSQQKVSRKWSGGRCSLSVYGAYGRQGTTPFSTASTAFLQIFSLRLCCLMEASLSRRLRKKKMFSLQVPWFLHLSTCAFFDGAEQRGICGCRVYILINESCHFSIH